MERNGFYGILFCVLRVRFAFAVNAAEAGWNLRNGKFWFIPVVHEIYAHTVSVCGFMCYVSVELNWFNDRTSECFVASSHMQPGREALILIENHKLLPMGPEYNFFPRANFRHFFWCVRVAAGATAVVKGFFDTPHRPGPSSRIQCEKRQKQLIFI